MTLSYLGDWLGESKLTCDHYQPQIVESPGTHASHASEGIVLSGPTST